MHMTKGLLAAFLLSARAFSTCAAPPEGKTFCNPLDLDYGYQKSKSGTLYRHGADPVVVIFKDRYYLFSTWDLPGYRVSDDLVSWTTIPFTAPAEIVGKTYTAAAVKPIGDWLYYTEFGKANRPVSMYRTQHPDTGAWEKVTGDLPPYADPCLFQDPPTGHLFMYYGLEKPIHGVQLDPATFAEVDGTLRQLMPTFTPGSKIDNGWEVCTWDNSEASKGMRSNKSFNPCREGSWMTYFRGTYYLQYASPGTTVPGYADGLLTGPSPLGPFVYSDYSPISHKDSGFITSAGHSCLFQDKRGQWWRAVTMLVGVFDRFERRIGLFPAGFDADGIPFTLTDRDLPLSVDSATYVPWGILSENKPVTASSEQPDHPARLASDEDVRTWWSARTGDAGEWLQLDLGRDCDVRALQINLAEQDVHDTDAPDVYRYTLELSSDGTSWQPIADTRDATVPSPHHYVSLNEPRRARYVRLRNLYSPGGGPFSLRDLRVFGTAGGTPPHPVPSLSATRGADRRTVNLSWTPSPDAQNYLVHYGITEGKWYQHHLVRGKDAHELTLYSLNAAPPYFFRVDALNENGLTPGTHIAEAK